MDGCRVDDCAEMCNSGCFARGVKTKPIATNADDWAIGVLLNKANSTLDCAELRTLADQR